MEFVKDISIGSDVEYFVGSPAGNKLASAEGLIPGTKQAPALFVPNNKYFATQLDNVLAEGNIPPAYDYVSFVKSMATLRAHMDAVLKPAKLVTIARAAGHIPDEFLQTENAKTFGCDSSYNCWTLKEEPVTPTVPTLRSAGFHIHVGYSKPRDEVNIAIARILDLLLGVTAVIEEPKSERREVGYGRAGNFRHQPHGCEYRVLSSHWASKTHFMRWAFSVASAVGAVLNGEHVIRAMKELTAAADDIQGVINTDDVAGAQRLRASMGKVLAGIVNITVPSQYVMTAYYSSATSADTQIYGKLAYNYGSAK